MGFEEESVWWKGLCLNLDLDWGNRERFRLRLHRGKAIEIWMVNAMVFVEEIEERERIRENVCVCVVTKFEDVV